MPLFDSLGTGQSIRLPKMSSIPTTEDLKYALAEAKKAKGSKLVELPFEHPSSGQLFLVKLVLGQGTAAPSWTLQQGENGKILWTRSTVDVLMIQNKIKIDSQYISGDTSTSSEVDSPTNTAMRTGSPRPTGAQSPPIIMGNTAERSQPIILGGPTSNYSASGSQSNAPSIHSRSYDGVPVESSFDAMQMSSAPPFDSHKSAPAQDSLGSGAAPATLDAFFSQSYPPALDSFLTPPAAPPPPSPPPGRYAGERAQSAAMPTASRPTGEYAQPPSVPAPGKYARPATPATSGEYARPATPVTSGEYAQPASPAPAAPAPVSTPVEPVAPPKEKLPLPPAIKFDKNAVNHVHRMLAEPTTGLMSFPAFVFFLFREFVRFQKHETKISVVIFEIALRMGNDIIPLPPMALAPIANRIRTVCSPLDIVCHLSAGEFGVLLAATDGAGALEFCASLHDALTEEQLFPGDNDEKLMVALGAASIPETCNHPEILVAAARQAKEMAKGTKDPFLLFPA